MNKDEVIKKRLSIDKKFGRYFFLAVAIVIICSLIGFVLFVDRQAIAKIIEFNLKNPEQALELQTIIRRGIIILLLNTLVISLIVMKITNKLLITPIKQITLATKKVATGDFNVNLESKRNDEIGELTENFNKMVKDIVSTEKLQKEFIDNVSHEIKTPISSIQGFAKMIRDGDITEEERKDYSQIIIDESNRLLNLSGNMLKLSKLQNQSKILNKESINITEQIRKAISLLEAKWSEKEIKFDINMEEKYYTCDEDLMFQVWTNLIDNGIKFSKDKGKIKISLHQQYDDIIVQFKDYGIGMDEDECKQVFTRFYQIDKSHSGKGFGLGLPIVKRIVELSNGTIWVESKINEGTMVTVKLPIEKDSSNVIIV